ncbi:FadR/GntR family transcriptional regulator [Azospirillum sp. SYSU D00513]|uniref:FadR/GntR family transcriptional regulator n=1 Tax=Azospirillum sp. SYSU D00513 TaxID=2812561 RepID=UPI001A95C80C|nr:FadR/GntR family transcriptional regulator [Azospirillum sp. SYSU D00513]
MVALKRRDTLAKQLVDAIAERIARGEYKSGEKLPSEQEFIDEFGVSRTVVREAIANLKAVGMVSTQQGVGAFVLRGAAVQPFRIDASTLELVNEAVSVLEVRISLESEAAYLAAIRRDETHLAKMRAAMAAMAAAIEAGEDAVESDLAFHGAIAEATGNRHFLALFTYLGTLLIPRARVPNAHLQGASRQEYLTRINQEHAAIHSAIERQDPEGARAAIRLHLNGSRERLRASGDTKVK